MTSVFVEDNTSIVFSSCPVIGMGGYGAVHKGLYKNKSCALKVLYPDTKCELDLLKEFSILQSFQHPNVVQYLATVMYPGQRHLLPVLVMELMDMNLGYYIASEETKYSITEEFEIAIAQHLGCGLAYIHEQRIIHRDLCVENVLIKLDHCQEFLVAKIADFGMSKLFVPSEKNSTKNHRKGILPPEARHEKKDEGGVVVDYDLSLDVFCCGVIMMQIILRNDYISCQEDRGCCLYDIAQGNHPLKPHILACVKNEKSVRPSAAELYKQLLELSPTTGSATPSVDENASTPYSPPHLPSDLSTDSPPTLSGLSVRSGSAGPSSDTVTTEEMTRVVSATPLATSVGPSFMDDVIMTMEQEVLNVLMKARDEYYFIGKGIGLDDADLKKIEISYYPDKLRCLYEMLTLRIQQGGLTHSKLCESLRGELVGRDDVAHQIEALDLYLYN